MTKTRKHRHPNNLSGRSLNLAIHREIFGKDGKVVNPVKINGRWHDVDTWIPESNTDLTEYSAENPPAGHYAGYMPDYTSSFSWRIVEKMIDRGLRPQIEYVSELLKWEVRFWNDQDAVWIEHEDRAVALARAALLAQRIFIGGGS